MIISSSPSLFFRTFTKPKPHFIISPKLHYHRLIITMRDRSKNRKPLQRGRYLSIEAIQTIQALKRASMNDLDGEVLKRVYEEKVKRLVKVDMIAVLRELQRQGECDLAMKVFEDVRKEHWYKPHVLVYSDMISMLTSNGLLKKTEQLFYCMKMEHNLQANTISFNALISTFMEFGFTGLAMESFQLLKLLKCEPEESTFKILIRGLEANGETSLSDNLRLEAEKYFGWPIDLTEENEEMT